MSDDLSAAVMWTPGPTMRFQVVDGLLYTPRGFAVICDGCGVHLLAPLDEWTQVFAILRPDLYAEAGVMHVVCPPPPGGPHACLVAARAAAEVPHAPGPACTCHSCRVAWHGRRALVPAASVPTDDDARRGGL